MIREWQKILSEFEVFEVLSEVGTHDHVENFDIVEPAAGEDQQLNHGGDDVCQDVENAPPLEEAIGKEQDNQDFEKPTDNTNENENENDSDNDNDNDNDSTDNADESDELNNDENGEMNRRSLYEEAIEALRIRRLRSAFATVISKVAEDLAGYDVDGDDLWDVEALMTRRFTNRPLYSCRKSLEKEKVILALDFSGSCWDYSNFFKSLAEIAEKFGDVEVFDASNGFSVSEDNYNLCLTDKNYYPFSYFKNRVVIFFGDFDGGASLVDLSRIAKVYWFSCEERYDDLDEHDWCDGYTLRDFKGSYYECISEADFMRLVKKIK